MEAQKLACTEKLSDAAHYYERAGKAYAHTEAVGSRTYNAVFACERLGSAENYAVNDYKGQIHAEHIVKRRQISLNKHLHYRYKAGYNNYVAGNSYL